MVKRARFDGDAFFAALDGGGKLANALGSE